MATLNLSEQIYHSSFNLAVARNLVVKSFQNPSDPDYHVEISRAVLLLKKIKNINLLFATHSSLNLLSSAPNLEILTLPGSGSGTYLIISTDPDPLINKKKY